jgi:NAD(P)-dependent dehydrogenase (short-subunit alcohol dehydrogenase family)
VEDTTEEMWDRIIDVNLKSYFLMSKFTIPEIRKRGGGVIVNTASVQGLQSMPGVPAYAASKGGILSLTRQMSLDYARENIRVVAVCPGAMDTPMLRTALEATTDDVEAAVRLAGETHPLGRIGTGRDIANAVLFLASDKASFMTGEYVCVDGGYMAMGAWASATPVSY